MSFANNHFKALLCVLLMGSLFAGGTLAAETTSHEHVTVEGRILDTPCSIDTGSRTQNINMGDTPVGVITRDGAGPRVPFAIRLRDCELKRLNRRLPNWQGFSIAFDGVTDGDDFATTGSAGGVALRIFDAKGDRAMPGKPLPDQQIVQGDSMLTFTLQLVSNKQPLRKGDYRAVIHFGISYF